MKSLAWYAALLLHLPQQAQGYEGLTALLAGTARFSEGHEVFRSL